MAKRLPDGSRLGFVATYHPLVTTSAGRIAQQRYGLPPFIDGSIRREPSLEHDLPSISGLCRTDRFVPRLRVSDCVAYVTVKRRWRGPTDTQAPPLHWRLTAVLRVLRVFDTHASAASWFREHQRQVPANCMVPDNPPQPIEHSHLEHKCAGKITNLQLLQQIWDREYEARATAVKWFVVCEPLFRALDWNAPRVREDDWIHVFNNVPGTQTPPQFPVEQLQRFLDRLQIPVRI